LKECPLHFRKNKELALIAVKSNPYALGCLPITLRHDKEILITALKINKEVFKYVPISFYDNKEICIYVNDKKYELISELLKQDKFFITNLVEKFPIMYQLIDDKFKHDKKIIETILSKNIQYFKHVPTDVKDYNYYALDVSKKIKNENYYYYENVLPDNILKEIGDIDAIEYFKAKIFEEELREELSGNNIKQKQFKL
jgi:hypothetical protein